MTTLFVKNLTVIDLSYLHHEIGLLGESWQVDIELDGSLDHQGMVLDFSEVKRQVKQTIDAFFDHRLLVPALHETCQITQQEHRCDIQFKLASGRVIRHSAPNSATALIQNKQIDENSLTTAISEQLAPLLPDNVDGLRLHLHTEAIDGAWYRYSHGLKHHAGNCQRIAHGHRSAIQIIRDGQRDLALETDWAQRWQDIYIGTRSDLQQELIRENCAYYRFGYTANQGLFELELPKSSCYLVNTDSTVENLAQHIAQTLKEAQPNSSFKVLAYEGVGKGAIGLA